MTYKKVQDNEHLLRDLKTNAIINSDYNSYQLYEQSYVQKYNEKIRISNLENEVTSIKNDLNEIKLLLRSFCNESK